MATTITLPIKCSTVKKADGFLDNIIGLEANVLFVVFFAWDISVIYRATVLGDINHLQDGATFGILYFGTIIWIFVGVLGGGFSKLIDAIFCLWNLIPSLACIKDDEVQP